MSRVGVRKGIGLGLAVAVMVASGLVSSPIRANDAVFGGEGVNLVPLRETRVRMVSEDVLLEQVPNRDYDTKRFGADARTHWRVEAVYQFENPTDQPVTLQMGFPERRCVDGCFQRRGAFHGLSTTVRGQLVPQREGHVALGGRWSRNLGRVYLYDVTFAPREALEIVHRYAFDASELVGGETLSYVTQTGTLWAGPIGHARFTVRPWQKPWIVQLPREYRVVSYTHALRATAEGAAPRFASELVLEMRNWTPRDNLLVHLIQDDHCVSRLLGLDCVCCYDDKRDHDGALCSSMLQAKYGKPFNDPALRQRFYVEPRQFDEDAEWCLWDWRDRFQRLWMAPNPDYAESMLTDWEHAEIEFFAGGPVPTYDPPAPSDAASTAPAIASVAPSASAPGETGGPNPAPPPSDQPPPSPPSTPPTPGCGHCSAPGSASGSGWGALGGIWVLMGLGWRRRKRSIGLAKTWGPYGQRA